VFEMLETEKKDETEAFLRQEQDSVRVLEKFFGLATKYKRSFLLVIELVIAAGKGSSVSEARSREGRLEELLQVGGGQEGVCCRI
jgi:hypothetical protein